MEWANPAVQAALVEAIGSIIATTVAGITAGIIGQQFANRRRLQEKLDVARKDVEFLLAVEQEHCSKHKATSDQSFKQTIRKAVNERGLTWSGSNTPGRVKTQ